MKKLFNVILLFACILLSANAQNSMDEQIDSLLTSLCEEYKTVGASAVLIDSKNDEKFFSEHGHFGDSTQLVNAQTLFRIGSITKTFTAISIMQLVEKGAIDLDKPVEFYLESLKNIKRSSDMKPFTISHLLSHTSGLRGEISNGLFTAEPRMNCISEELLNDTILTSPGEIYAYSNAGYGILGCLIEDVSGLSYGDYLKQHIFDPIGMINSGLFIDLMNTKLMSDGFNKNIRMPAENPVSYTSAGDIVSNTSDMLLFLECLLNDGKNKTGTEIITASSLALMQENHNETSILNTGKKIGYGFFIKAYTAEKDAKKIKYLTHGGDTHLFHAYLSLIPEEGVGIAVFTNSKSGNRVASRFKSKAAKLYLSESRNKKIAARSDVFNADLFPKETNLSIDKLVGEYGMGVGNLIFKKKGKNKLKGKTDFKSPKFKLKQESGNVYSAKVILLGLIPFKVKDMKFAFEDINNNIYCKMIYQGDSESEYMGMKRINDFPTTDWENYAGKYQVVNLKKGNATMTPSSIKVDNNLIYLTLESSTGGKNQSITFEPSSKDFASANVVGRGMGEYIKVLDNGNLYFSGFEMKKI